jgi:ribosomal-protein-alanine N-acetyltransferase
LRAVATAQFQTERLRMRLLREGDGELLAAAFRANREWLAPWDPVRPREFCTRAYQERSVAASRREAMQDQGYRLIAFERDAGENDTLEAFAGMIAVANISRGVFQNATLGYWIVQGKAGRGLGREMVGAASDWAFDRALLHRIQAAIQPDNIASKKLILAVGFRHEGFAPRYLKIAGEWRDHEIFAKTIEDRDEQRAAMTSEH